jgi:hypothetical protein
VNEVERDDDLDLHCHPFRRIALLRASGFGASSESSSWALFTPINNQAPFILNRIRSVFCAVTSWAGEVPFSRSSATFMITRGLA